ncbi:zonular occludens toxin domain-containing protein [Novosphingobium sp. 11B]
MAITAYTGVPGSGKSYTMIEQLMVPAVMAGRRVLTNIAGVQPEKVYELCQKRSPDTEFGEVVLFDASIALNEGFFPTENISDEHTFVKGGDFLLFDEWRLTFPKRGAFPTPHLEPFLRYHRHLTDKSGVAIDVAIGTQLVTDIHLDIRGLVERSYKFRKLKAIGLPKFYKWDMFEGSTQPKGESVSTGNGKYKQEIFNLYKSYDTDGDGKELKTDKRSSIWSPTLIAMIAGIVVMGSFSLYMALSFFGSAGDTKQPGQNVTAGQPVARSSAAPAQGGIVRARSPYRIVGHVAADTGLRIVLADDNGSVRVVAPDGFSFDGDRPVYGVVDGMAVVADDRVKVSTSGVAAPQFGVQMP